MTGSRSGYWRQHLTAHGPANKLLLAFQNQHRLPARFSEILGFPLGTALSILQVLGDDSLPHLLIALTLSIAATAAVLTTRYGRLVLSSLRGGLGKR
ncbi:hypothetical protein ACFYQA_21555 [Streptomyces sp. NPDC005774]|uniref:hypothetical protein n=1 Tax=Streptomyces sp. NPDC005774 TaxID=3364728 RepID=UPI0036A1D821